MKRGRLKRKRGVTLVVIDKGLLKELLESAEALHPREVILVLRGKIEQGEGERKINVTDYLIPPQAIHGISSSAFNPHMIPIDFSIVGTMHSHPSGVLLPSITDLNFMVGFFAVIVVPPYRDPRDVATFDRRGEPVHLVVE